MVSLRGVCSSIIIGVLPLCWLATLPGTAVLVCCALAGGLLLMMPAGIIRYGGITILMVCWACLNGHQVLGPATLLTGQVIQAEGTLIRYLGGDRYLAHLGNISGERRIPGVTARIQGLKSSQPLCPGQRWALQVQLRPVHGQLNIPGFDSQRHSVANRQSVTGRVRQARQLSASCSWRSRFITYIGRQAGPLSQGAVLQALAFGDRRELLPATRALLRDTGTAHLMAISGLHIAQSAGVFWLIARLIQFLFPVVRIGPGFPLLYGIGGAAMYTWISGANPPAMRAMLALLIWSGLRLSGRKWSPEMVWLCCVSGLLLFDPLAILSDSFRLSAGATGALILWYRWVPHRAAGEARWRRYLSGLVHLQMGIGGLLLPLQWALFHGISLTALPANLLAVPVVTLLVVPLLLLGMAASFVPGVTRLSWWLAGEGLDGVLRLLSLMPHGWLALDSRAIGFTFLPLLLMVVWRLALYRTSPSIPLVALLLCSVPYWRQLSRSPDWAVHMLDVGNGLAIVIEKNKRALLYDTGNRWPGGDSAKQVIIPWLRWHALVPEGVIISHGHLDHIGGLDSIINAWPGIPVYSAMLTPGHRACFSGESWQWQGLDFQVLWPPRSLPGAENNHSCVVRVSHGNHSVLLTGDIESPAELAMLKAQRGNVQASVLQVPHHGSRTSSTPLLLRYVNPNVALASVARYNPWRFPSARVVARYRERGIGWLDTGQSGQITVQMFSERIEFLSARMQIYPRWYHQWFGVPADSG